MALDPGVYANPLLFRQFPMVGKQRVHFSKPWKWYESDVFALTDMLF